MASFDFNYGPRLHCGAGACARLPALTGEGAVLLVTDAGVRKLGLCDLALAAFEAAGREVIVFDAVEADPSADTVLTATQIGRDAQVGAVVGLGGGSPMDVAKLAAYLLGSGDSLDAIYGVEMAKGPRLPLALVPTTAGTGSEATPVAIVTVGGAEKKGVVAQALYGDWAVLDAELTLGLPPHVTAATGVDAMVHAIEAYTSARLKNPLSDAMAERALRLLSTHIRTAVHDGANRDAREAMLLGAHLAGIAFAGRGRTRPSLSSRRPFPCPPWPVQRPDAAPCAGPQHVGRPGPLRRARRDDRSDAFGAGASGPRPRPDREPPPADRRLRPARSAECGWGGSGSPGSSGVGSDETAETARE
jgi:alcohol dehydrogenase class IV